MKSKRIAMLAACFVLHAAVLLAYPELHIMDNMHVRSQPDVIADTVTRTSETGGSIPVLLALRHTNLYPTILKKITMTADLGEGYKKIEKTIDYDLKLNRFMWHEVREIELPADFRGEVFVNVEFDIQTKKEKKVILNNNIRGSKHEPLRVLAGAPPLPAFSGWYFGDPHFHTDFSSNQAEFGAPLDVSARMAERFGMGWQVFTDHSFDLDDTEENSEINDPALPRWKRFNSELKELSVEPGNLIFMSGEEVSCGNSQSQNVHMLVMNNEKLYIGNGDGYEGNNVPDFPCVEVVSSLTKEEVAYAAHPIVKLLSVEMYVINRGNWAIEDMMIPGLHGVQAWNQTWSPRPEGFEAWKQLLLRGERKFFLAGTDAHGSFNREYAEWPAGQPFGGIRSAVHVDGELTLDKLVQALRQGKVTTTSGPMAIVEIVNAAGQVAEIGGEITGGGFRVVARVKSSEEFGPVREVRIIAGDLEKGEEIEIAKYYGRDAADPMNVEETVTLPDSIRRGYVRVEASSVLGDLVFQAYTNPIWFEIK